MKPEEILMNVRETYRSLKSYSDRGTVEILHAVGKKSIEFNTYFVRPAKVRFEWRKGHHISSDNPNDTHALWSNGEETFAWYRNQLNATDLRKAAASFTGVSSGSVLMILNLLLPEPLNASQAWCQMENVMEFEDDDEEINGFLCHHLRGTTTRRDDTDCWISRDDMLVRRLSRKTEISADEANKMLGTAVDLLHKMGDSTSNMFSSSADLLQKITASEKLPRQLKSDISYTSVYNYNHVTTDSDLADDLFTANPTALMHNA